MSGIPYPPEEIRNSKVDINKSIEDLIERYKDCKLRMMNTGE